MKKIYLLLLVFINTIQSQEIIFNKEIQENTIQSRAKVSADYYKMSSKIKYCKQSDFNLEQDLKIELFENKNIVAKYFGNSILKIGSISYKYRIENDPNGLVVFTIYKNFLVGSIDLGTGERYHISQTIDNNFSFLEINPSFFGDESCMSDLDIEKENKIHQTNKENKSALAHSSVCTSGPCSNSVVDLMVFFTNQTIASLVGGEIEAVAGTSNQVVVGNQGYIDSGITNLQLNLVYAAALNYNDDPTDLSIDKSYIKNTAALVALRNQYGADLVSIFTRTQGSGTGDNNTNATDFNSNAAYSAIHYSYVLGKYSLYHETGHNMGMRHDWNQYQDDLVGGAKPCNYHHGYSNQVAIALGTNSANNQRWRTIMSYENQFSSVGINNSIRLNRWSNPNLLYNGDAMGIAATESNNYPSNEKYALERTGCIVAAFKTAPLLNLAEADNITNVSFYPNPTKNKLFVSEAIYGYKIYNIDGKVIKTSTSKTTEIDVSILASGSYIMEVKLENEQKQNFKFVKN